MEPRGIVLSFHGIGTPPLGIPDEERPFWIAEDLFAAFIASAPSKAKALGVDLFATFDDGNRSDLEIAAPLLARHGVAGAFFPCSGRVAKAGYLSEDDIRRLFALGFEIGSHGIDHVPWTEQGNDGLDREVVGSMHTLESILGEKIRTAAIPFGKYNRRVLAKLKATGYTKIYSSDRGFGNPTAMLTRRWTYKSDEPFDLGYFVAKSSSIRNRLMVEAKGIIKALR